MFLLFFIVLMPTAGTAFGCKRLLFDNREAMERFWCRLARVDYPPHPEEWGVRFTINKVKFLLWFLLVFSSLFTFVGVLSIFASIALLFFKH